MRKKEKVVLFIFMMIFLFSIFQIGKALAAAETLSLTNVEVINKSETVDINNLNYEGRNISNDVTFHKLGDSITYGITLKNNEDKDYTLKNITDNNTNEYISIQYDNYADRVIKTNEELSFDIIITYLNELTDLSDREQSFNVNISLELEDEDGNTSEEDIYIDNTDLQPINIPNTGDNVNIYIVLAAFSFGIVVLLIVRKHQNNAKKFFNIIVCLAIVATCISKVYGVSFDISIQNMFKLYDKVIITTEVDGEIVYETINYGDTMPKPEDPVKPGYTFIGWYLEDGTEYDFSTPITGDIVINPAFEKIEYTITCNLNNGEESNSFKYTVEDEIRLDEPTKEGYTFIGWSGNDLIGEDNIAVIIPKGSIGDRTYTAHYEANKYTLVFDPNTGTGNMDNQEVEYDSTVNINNNKYTKTGYAFKNWNTKADGTGLSYENGQEIRNLATHGNITIYAQWQEIKIGDYVNYNPSSGEGAGLQYTSEDLQALVHNDSTCSITGKFKSNESIRWRVFSIEDDGIQLIAEKPLTNTLTLSGPNGYIYGEEILDDICNIYGHGIGALDARSIKLEDIEPHFKYDKRNFTFGNAYYGRVKSYASGYFIVGNEIVTATATQNQEVAYTAYWFNIKNSAYIYTEQENAISNKIYQMLCEDISIINPNQNNPNYTPYWVANKCARSDDSSCAYGLHYVGDMHYGGNAQVELGIRSMFNNSGTKWQHENGILPIVKLNSITQLRYNSDDNSWNIDVVDDN